LGNKLAEKAPVILVVDDEFLLRELLDRVLRVRGFCPLLAGSGKEAVEIYKKRGTEIALVLLDVRMPGMDGLQTLTALRRVDPDLRCCFMSGDLGDYSQAEIEASGALQLFSKPFALHELLTALRRLTAKED
jgi:CheY-like chemotaxis protein